MTLAQQLAKDSGANAVDGLHSYLNVYFESESRCAIRRTMKIKEAIFISHATPEDNGFASWLSLQLTIRGYKTWCDTVKLLGGEDWWTDIDVAIRDHSCRFLHLASRRSVKKSGVIRELDAALAVPDAPAHFIIPLKLDDVPYADFPRDLGKRLNAVDFSKSWASGLHRLLERLEEDNVPKNLPNSADRVADFWRTNFPPTEGTLQTTESYLSNWWSIPALPETICLHRLSQGSHRIDVATLSVPTEINSEFLISFASSAELARSIMDRGRIKESYDVKIADLLDGGTDLIRIRPREAENHLLSIFRKAWAENAKRRKFSEYALANDDLCFWMQQGILKNDEAQFVGVDGRIHRRAIVGVKNYRAPDRSIKKSRMWHFAVQGRPRLHPFPAFSVRLHVVFSEDGKTPIESASRQHSARRSQCKQWWNDHWRDRMLATMALMANPGGSISLPLSSCLELPLSLSPEAFLSPVSYTPVTEQKPEDIPEEIDEWEISENPEGVADA